MKLIGFESLVGGAGATTLSANVAGAMQRVGHRIAVVDCCPDNQLAAYFALPTVFASGWASDLDDTDLILSNAFVAESGVVVVPYGWRKKPADDVVLQSAFQQVINALNDHPTMQFDSIILNLPTGFSYQSNFKLPANTHCILVFEPEPRSYIALQRWQYVMPKVRDVSYFGLVNKVASQLELQRDTFDLFSAILPSNWLVPLHINRDQHVPEALATQQLLFEYTLGSQAGKDIMQFADWLQQHTGTTS